MISRAPLPPMLIGKGPVGPIPDPEGPADVSSNLFVDVGPVDFIPPSH